MILVVFMRPLGKVEGHAAGVVFQLRTLIHFIVALLRWINDNITEFIQREIWKPIKSRSLVASISVATVLTVSIDNSGVQYCS